METKRKPKIYVVEGQNGSGKETTCKLLRDRLELQGLKVAVIDYPQYGKKSAKMVEMYLNKELTNDVRDIPPYLSGLFYAVDRGLDYHLYIKHELDRVDVIIFDRYSSANILYQTGLIEDKEEKLEYARFMLELEHNRVGIPVPDKVFLLTLPNDLRKTSDGDLHEADAEFEQEVFDNQRFIANEFGWIIVNCYESGVRLTPCEVIDKIEKEIRK